MAFNFYFAGTQCVESSNLLRDLNANVLKSYVNDRKELLTWFEYKRQGWKGNLLIDSGAFTVHRRGGSVDIDAYIDWLNENDEYIDYAIELDHIPGKWGTPRTPEEVAEAPILTWQNYLYMYDRLKSPKKLLPVFHQHESLEHLENILKSDKPEYICISGNKELTNAQRERWYKECYTLINKINPNIKVHCLGSATMSNVEKFPFTSMDATSWIMTGANGNILTDFGAVYVGDNCQTLKHSGPPEAYDVIKDYCAKYGITPEQIGSDYKYRMLMNIHYLYDKSRTVECKNIKTPARRKLF